MVFVVVGISTFYVNEFLRSYNYSWFGISPVINNQKTDSGIGSLLILGSYYYISGMERPLNLIPSEGSKEEHG